MPHTAEHDRLDQANRGEQPWRRWGAYLSERQWGTVREDYSADGSAWTYFSHDHARSRAYRWGEDGIAGFGDEQCRLCMSLALWNGRDPILKERYFGVTGAEGNHGEDCKELYYYLDATPTQSYLKLLYKYPQAEFPYARLIEENQRRGKGDAEFELLDTGVFEGDRYFDVFVEYAKAGAEDVLMRITVKNRGPQAATVHVLPQVWFRNTWAWEPNAAMPRLQRKGATSIAAHHPELGDFTVQFDGKPEPPELLFTNNESNSARLWGTTNNGTSNGYVKDAFHERVVHGKEDAVNPQDVGTKAAAWYVIEVPAEGEAVVRVRLSKQAVRSPMKGFDEAVAMRRAEADAFYADVQQDVPEGDARQVQRQAYAGLIWSRQFYHLDIPRWHDGDPTQPTPPESRWRNREWRHLNNADVLTMPDKWEYPYYCAWDTAFQCVPLARIDPEWAKYELVLLTREWYMHPNGQLPAYEWAYGDVNPPVHAWSTWKVYEIDRQITGKPDRAFLERVFHKLLLNFTWWVNRKDAEGRNIFQGGFLGMDNIGVFDRSAQLPTGGFISQADGTSWMAMYCLNLMRIALELAQDNPVYQDTATKFFEHFLYIAAAMKDIGGSGLNLWCDEDEFFYDVLCLPDGRRMPMKVRTMVGLTPLFAVEVLDSELLDRVPEFRARLEWFLNYRPDLASLVSRWSEPGMKDTRLLSLLRGHRMKRLLKRMLDETEFLSEHGVRSVSRIYAERPYEMWVCGQRFAVQYTPAESDTYLFGGNSNWRGPIWMPVNFMLIDSLRQFHRYYGDDFKIECPTGSGVFLTIREVADELARRLTSIFLKDSQGRRPVFNHNLRLQSDPHFRDHVLFHEYFDGDTGRGVGASHQTGWTALTAALLDPSL